MPAGRRQSEGARLRAYVRWVREQENPPRGREVYRDHLIEWVGDCHWIYGGPDRRHGLWPVDYPTLEKARAAVDRCLALRAELAAEKIEVA